MGLFGDIVKTLLTEADAKENRLKRIIAQEFSGLLDVNGPVRSDEYYVNGDPNTTWLDYLVFHFKHEFGLMTNDDMKYYDIVAKLAYSREVGFDKRDGNGSEIAIIQQIVMLLKHDEELFNQVKANIGNLTFTGLYNELKPQLDAIAKADAEAANNVEEREGYEIKEVPDFRTANYYGEHTCSTSKLCYATNINTWRDYTKNGENRVYVCLKNGWEDIPEVQGPGNPYDEYGTSMIFVFVDPNGNLAYSNCRWNHKVAKGCHYEGSTDHAFTKASLSQTVGVRFDRVFKPNPTYFNENAVKKDFKDLINRIDEVRKNGSIIL